MRCFLERKNSIWRGAECETVGVIDLLVGNITLIVWSFRFDRSITTMLLFNLLAYLAATNLFNKGS